MWPVHTWLPDAHTEAPAAESVILAGVLIKMGAYGFLHFSLPLLPQATLAMMGPMLDLSVVAIVYGAFVCLAQRLHFKIIFKLKYFGFMFFAKK